MQTDEQQILKLFEEGDRALIAADVAELHRIYADDYVQYDERGRVTTKKQMINTLTSGKTRFVSMISTGRQVRQLSDNVAIVNGSEEDEVEQNGSTSTIRYVYMDAVMNRAGKWCIVASQLARSAEPARGD
jgi:Domain of unknown function (DUF4440)